MHIEAFREFCLHLPGATEDFPFGEETLVFKVGGKMFALTDMDTFESINLKCEPEKAVELREQYEGVLPGYHMNKKHWNTVLTDGSVPDVLLKEWIRDSYELVVQSLPKKVRECL
ncbi:MmcQ/YjbR family DNA-binding protein [Nafulsella turpanensis]|uniref:MmcQ/YjbR family DNA-binding protein n=1 Tax=Nafulsella turpanensis TaxID=1265690 RepID=UPI00034A7DED|nr:MmcQ/YjbR family DNA-binding protein [Nafulsella turpanensis]